MKLTHATFVAIIILMAFLFLPMAGMAADSKENNTGVTARSEENGTLPLRIPQEHPGDKEIEKGPYVEPVTNTSTVIALKRESSPAVALTTEQDLRKASMRPLEIASTSPSFLLPMEYQDVEKWKKEELPSPKTTTHLVDANSITLYNSTTKKVTNLPSKEIPQLALAQATAPEFRGAGSSKPEPGTIFGPDDRVLVNSFSSTDLFPWRSIVNIYMTWPNGQGGGCTGALIDPHHVLTAGHCVYNPDRGGWATITVIPGQNDTYAPYWLAYSDNIIVPTPWYDSWDWHYDIAVFNIDRSVGDFTGWMGRSFPADSSYSEWAWYTGNVNTAGYPGDIGGGVVQVYTANVGNAVSDTNHWFFNDVNNGQSGSPTWFYEGGGGPRYIMSVVTMHEVLDTGHTGNVGTRISPWVESAMIQYKFNNDPEPINHAELLDDGDAWNAPNKTLVRWDEPLLIQTDVRNRGTENSGGFYVDYYLSTDSTITPSDHLLGWVWISDVSPFNYAHANLVMSSFPRTIPPGTYYIGYWYDSLNGVVEYDESNNIFVDSAKLTVAYPNKPDLLDDGVYSGHQGWYFSLNKTSFYQNEPFEVHSDVRNRGPVGSGAFYVNYYLSTDNTITTSDYYIGYDYISSVAAGDWEDSDYYGSIPGNIPAGTYYLGCIIDRYSEVNEFDETNNIAVDDDQYTILARSIGVTSPDGNQTWLPGSAHTITWTQTGLSGTNVRILLMKGYGFNIAATIADPVPATQGSYSWTVPTTLAGGTDYWVKIQSLTYPEVQGDMWSGWITIPNPVPTLTSISPTSKNAGDPAFTLAVNGTGFYAGSKVRWNGTNRTTNYVSPTRLTATISADDIKSAGSATVTVFNPAPGGGTSGPLTFMILHPVPTITSISPTSKNAGDPAFTLAVNGTGFYAGSKVRWNGTNRTTNYVSPTKLTASISADDIKSAGSATVTVFNPAPGGGTSGPLTFTISPVPKNFGRGLFRPSTFNNWIIDRSMDGTIDIRDHYGSSNDKPIIADFNNDRTPDRALFRAGEWIIDYSMDGSINLRNGYGQAGDVPLAGRMNADGVTDRAVFRNGTWIIDYSTDGTTNVRNNFGTTGDIPLIGDFNNDYTPDRAVFRPSSTSNNWIIDYGMNGIVDVRNRFGQNGDIPLIGDFNADGITDRAVFRAGEWIIDYSMDGSINSRPRFGQAGDIPLVWNL